MNKLFVSEIFYSLQGEGPTIGIPVIFLRLQSCNLKCSYCDSKYALGKGGKELAVKDIAEEVFKYPRRRLVITGGEPLLQQEAVEKLLKKYFRGWVIEIETNGTIIPSKYLRMRCQFNCSPKLENSGNSLDKRYKPKILRELNKYCTTFFKFVVISKEDIKEIEEIIKECKLDKDKIILMPEGVSMKSITKHAKEVVDLALQRGWRLLPRLQIMLWGNKRGV